MKNNVLILSAGRRVELVQQFQQDLKKFFPEANVFCTDMCPALSAACHVAFKAFKVPRATDESYIGEIIKICSENNVGLVVPTIDTELLILSQNRHIFAKSGISAVISDENFVSLCRDKRKTASLFESLSIDQPRIFKRNDLSFPCFCKPYDGSCSIGAVALKSIDDLTAEILDNPKNMFMELIPKTYTEYTVDAYYTNEGVLRCLVPRKRLEVRGGEVSKAVTKMNFVYDYLIEKLGFLSGARGCITLQFFVNEEDHSIKGLEINPRFGGGYPLTYSAGAHFPDWIIREFLLGETPNFYDGWDSGLVMLRYDAKVLSSEV